MAFVKDSSRDINLGVGNWEGADTDGTTVWFVDDATNYARAWTASTRARDEDKDINLGNPTGLIKWDGVVCDGTTLWFTYHTVINTYARAYVASTRVRDEDKDIYFGRGQGARDGSVTDGTTLWFIGISTAYAYNASTQARDANKDINLLSNASFKGGFTDRTTLWFVGDTNDYARAYDLSKLLSRDPMAVRDDTRNLRDATRDINLGTGSWRGGVRVGDDYWIIDDTTNYARAYFERTNISARDTTKDLVLGSGAGSDYTGAVTDGTTFWITENSLDTAKAYVLRTRARDEDKDLSLIHI